ncbi:MAG: hypothetical protein IKU29_06220 [Parabacteroides sp.]|nr:hypothetical protein [Parabacteroides sp.]
MTRKERLKKYLEERNIPIDSLEANSILEGIEWADEHPKEGLVSIDKVYEYLNKNIFQSYTYNAGNKIGYLKVNNKFVSKDSFFENFHKSMEE